MNTINKAILALEDGRVFRGRSWAADGEACGEMVFNTSMSGYQEVLTDPSYAGQIVCMTYPLIGNYGVNDEDTESSRPWVEGFVVREASRVASNWRSEESLADYLKRWNIVAIDHIDTRALVRHIRDKGAMRACLSTIVTDADSVIEKARESHPMENRELASVVTTDTQALVAKLTVAESNGTVTESASTVGTNALTGTDTGTAAELVALGLAVADASSVIT